MPTTKVKDIMTPNPACCTPGTGLRQVAEMFVEHDCGAVPVVADLASRRPIGVVTDRDIACRAIAAGKNALELEARDCMSSNCIAVPLDTPLDACCEVMEKNQVRRIVVVDGSGACCGMVSQADLALKGKDKKAVEVLKHVSRPRTAAPARA
jgi:CBS domain-containing protein